VRISYLERGKEVALSVTGTPGWGPVEKRDPSALLSGSHRAILCRPPPLVI